MTVHAEHVYLHVPFCRTRCPYCDYAVTLESAHGERWARALGRELELRAAAGELTATRLRSLHLGGGTPSLLGDQLPARVRDLFGETEVEWEALEEWGVEANPEDLSQGRLEAWRSGGVTRVVIGVQSLTPEALRFLGRGHTPEGAVQAMRAAATAGLDSWGIDLLFGLPEAMAPEPLAELERILELEVPDVGLFELTVEPGTPLAEAVERGDLELPDEDRQADLYLALVERLEEAGYLGDAPTAWSRPGHASRHGAAVRAGEPFLGLGPGAHSFLGEIRSWNSGDWGSYLKMLEMGRVPREGEESPDPSERELERLWADLGSARGLEPGELTPAARGLLETWTRAGWARPHQGRIRLTSRGWLRLDSLVVELYRIRPFR